MARSWIASTRGWTPCAVCRASSRATQSQIEIIQKAMGILSKSTSGVVRSAPENDELSRLLAAVSL